MCRATVAVSTADSGFSSMMKPSKLSAIILATAFGKTRTTRVWSIRQIENPIATGLGSLDLDSKSGRELPQKTQTLLLEAGILPFSVGSGSYAPGPLQGGCAGKRRRRTSCAVRKCIFPTWESACGPCFRDRSAVLVISSETPRPRFTPSPSPCASNQSNKRSATD